MQAGHNRLLAAECLRSFIAGATDDEDADRKATVGGLLVADGLGLLEVIARCLGAK